MPSTKPNVPLKRLVYSGAAFFVLGAIAVTQQQQDQQQLTGTRGQRPDLSKMKVSNEVDDFYFTTKVGSFKFLPRGDTLPSGTLIISFTGSVLVSELHGTIVPTGAIRREYFEQKRNKQVWFGTGKLVIKGDFSSVQWFGRDLTGEFHGNGYVRLYGEFDKNLDTGWYWFDPTKKRFWGNYGTGVPIPEQVMGGGQKPMMRDQFNKDKGKQPTKTGGG